MTNPLISIIVPVYNMADYLYECMDSIIGQTYKELQIICVDDGSTDKSADILKDYQKKDSRIEVYEKENEGVSLARNYGLGKARGEYVVFVDGDDWIDLETCERALQTAQCNNADVVMWTYVREHGAYSQPKDIFEKDVVFEGSDTKDKLHRRMMGIVGEELNAPENADALCTVWGKLYKKSIIDDNDISFYDIRKIGTYEDGLFNLNYLKYVNRAVYINRYFYHYRRNNVNSITSKYNPDLTEQKNVLFSVMKDYIVENKMPEIYYTALNNRVTLDLIPTGINVVASQASVKNKIKAIKDIISSDSYKEAISQLKFSYLPIHWKVYFGCAKAGFAGGVLVLLMIIQKLRGH